MLSTGTRCVYILMCICTFSCALLSCNIHVYMFVYVHVLGVVDLVLIVCVCVCVRRRRRRRRGACIHRHVCKYVCDSSPHTFLPDLLGSTVTGIAPFFVAKTAYGVLPCTLGRPCSCCMYVYVRVCVCVYEWCMCGYE